MAEYQVLKRPENDPICYDEETIIEACKRSGCDEGQREDCHLRMRETNDLSCLDCFCRCVDIERGKGKSDGKDIQS